MNRDIRLKGTLGGLALLPLILTIVLAAFDAWIFHFNTQAGVTGMVFVIVYFVIILFLYLKNRKEIMNELIDFATQYGSTQKRLLEEFEIPYVLMDPAGKLLWMNKAFAEVSGKPRKYHKSITSIFPEITRESFENQDEVEITVYFQEHIYRASVKKVYFESLMQTNGEREIIDRSQYLQVVFLYDETELNYYIQENHDMQMAVALVYIDNYDEVLDSVEEVKQALLFALVDRRVNKYFSGVDGIVKKFESDKYVVVLKRKQLALLKEDKFSILEEVKGVKAGNEMAVTLSIGVGDCGVNYIQNYESARTAIDLALGRGGDQVVVKEMEKISYFGGKARHLEKNTRVKARVKALALREIMISKDHFLVMGHSITDIDSFGAAIGICCAARVLGKRAQIVLNDVTSSIRPVKELFKPENGYPEDLFVNSQQAMEIVDKNTAVIVVDTNKKNYVECPSLLRMAHTIVVFDHHRQGSDVIDNATLSYIEPYASSACEMIAEVLQYFDETIKLTPAEADSIYAGILIDTNNFMTKTGVRTFEAAAYLRRCGAEVTRVRKMMRNGMDDYKARAEAVRNAEVYRNSFAISVCPGDKVESPTIACAQAANELLNIIGIKASFVMTEYNSKIYISARSIDEINVQLVMERLGGGGHLNTAGAQLTEETLSEARWKIKQTLDEMIREGDLEA